MNERKEQKKRRNSFRFSLHERGQNHAIMLCTHDSWIKCELFTCSARWKCIQPHARHLCKWMHSLVATSQLQFCSGLTNAYEYIAWHSHSFKLAQKSKLRTHREGRIETRLNVYFLHLNVTCPRAAYSPTHTVNLNWISGKFDEISPSLSLLICQYF